MSETFVSSSSQTTNTCCKYHARISSQRKSSERPRNGAVRFIKNVIHQFAKMSNRVNTISTEPDTDLFLNVGKNSLRQSRQFTSRIPSKTGYDTNEAVVKPKLSQYKSHKASQKPISTHSSGLSGQTLVGEEQNELRSVPSYSPEPLQRAGVKDGPTYAERLPNSSRRRYTITSRPIKSAKLEENIPEPDIANMSDSVTEQKQALQAETTAPKVFEWEFGLPSLADSVSLPDRKQSSKEPVRKLEECRREISDGPQDCSSFLGDQDCGLSNVNAFETARCPSADCRPELEDYFDRVSRLNGESNDYLSQDFASRVRHLTGPIDPQSATELQDLEVMIGNMQTEQETELAPSKIIVSQLGGVTITKPDSRSRSPVGSTSSMLRTTSRSQSRSRSRRTKKYPPGAFPEDFYDRFPDPDPMFPYGVIDMQLTDPARTTSFGFASPAAGSPQVSSLFLSPVMSSPALGDPNVTENLFPITFYTTQHYFTDCPHTSPPATRPLNAQPRYDPTYDRSIIKGACFGCDSDRRRQQEHLIVMDYTFRLERLTNKLSDLIEKLESEDSITISNATDLPLTGYEDDVFTEAVASAIRAIEDEIEELKNGEECDVKRVWQGYTARWGPGTLGVQRTYVGLLDEDSEDLADDKTTNDQMCSTEHAGEDMQSLSRKAITNGKKIHSSQKMNTGLSSSSRAIPGEGRMKIDWIRPDR